MIKIQLDNVTKTELISMHLNDAKKAKTGLFNILQEKKIKSFLKHKHYKIYTFFYEPSGELNKSKIEKLLLADKSQMVKYISILGKYHPNDPKDVKASNELIDNIFKYDSFSKRKVAYDIMKKMDVRVCPYCNRQYTVTLKNHKVRPQFDHYFPKSEYPYLALTLFNLVPSCSICNLSKSSLDTDIDPILYPFDEEFGEEIIFCTKIHEGVSITKYLHGLTDEFDVKIANPKGIMTAKVNKQVNVLHLEDLYNEHKDYIQDIAKNHYINSEKRADELLTIYPLLFRSKIEVMNTFYMNDIRKDNWGNRPLSKLTKDICDELEIQKKIY